MTIKHQGGIFGRNPTFNNVDVDGVLTVDTITEKTGASGVTLDGVTLKDGNVVLANGKGIDFSATSGTGTSELFDDYEEGSFSPVIEGTTSAGTATYSRQAGVYTKVGNCVNFWVDIIYSSGSGSGNLKITGLPYTSSSTTMVKTYFAHTYDISLTAGNIAAATLSLNATQLLIKQLPTGGGATSSVAYDAAGEIQITGSYFV